MIKHYTDVINRRIFFIFLLAALIVVVVRALGPLPMGWDQSISSEGGHRLAQGKGLTTTYFATQYPDINKEPHPEILTRYPPALSLMFAGIVLSGFPFILTLKCIYSLATLLGWLGWGLIGAYALRSGIRLARTTIPLHAIIALSLPLLFTPRWFGSDIFAWVGVPFIIYLLYIADRGEKVNVMNCIAAGLIYGIIASIRYGSVFMGLAAGLILIQLYYKRIRLLIVSSVSFGFAALCVLGPVLAFNNYANSFGGLPTYLPTTFGQDSIPHSIERIFRSLSSISVMYGFRPSEVIIAFLRNTNTPNIVYGVVWLVIIATLPYILSRVKDLEVEGGKDVLISCIFVQISLILQLSVLMFSPLGDWLGDVRYYVPAGPCGAFIIYAVITRRAEGLRHVRKTAGIVLSIFVIVAVVASLCVIGFLIVKPSVTIIGRTIVPGDLVQPILGYKPSLYAKKHFSYPSNKKLPLFKDCVDALKELKKKYPDAIVYVGTGYPHFVYDGYDGFRRLPLKGYWKTAYVSHPVKIFWLVDIDCDDICRAKRRVINNSALHSALKVVATFPHEGTKILVSDLSGGFRFYE